MKIKTYKDLEDGVYKVKIHATDYSELDRELMANYGEPEINIGGLYEAEPAEPALLAISFSANPASTGFVAGYGTIEFNANPAEDTTVTIDDGTESVVFEFGTVLSTGDILVDNSVDAATTLSNLDIAIGTSDLNVTTNINLGVLTVTHANNWQDIEVSTSDGVNIEVAETAHEAPANTTLNISDGTTSIICEIKRSTEPLVNLNALAVDNDTDAATTLLALKDVIEDSDLNVTTAIAAGVLTLTHVATDANFTASTVDNDIDLVDTEFVPPVEPVFTLPNNYSLINSGSPFTAKFDKRDSDDAEDRANLWTTTVVDRLKDAIVTLRALNDTFSGESVETF